LNPPVLFDQFGVKQRSQCDIEIVLANLLASLARSDKQDFVLFGDGNVRDEYIDSTIRASKSCGFHTDSFQRARWAVPVALAKCI